MKAEYHTLSCALLSAEWMKKKKKHNLRNTQILHLTASDAVVGNNDAQVIHTSLRNTSTIFLTTPGVVMLYFIQNIIQKLCLIF